MCHSTDFRYCLGLSVYPITRAQVDDDDDGWFSCRPFSKIVICLFTDWYKISWCLWSSITHLHPLIPDAACPPTKTTPVAKVRLESPPLSVEPHPLSPVLQHSAAISSRPGIAEYSQTRTLPDRATSFGIHAIGTSWEVKLLRSLREFILYKRAHPFPGFGHNLPND